MFPLGSPQLPLKVKRPHFVSETHSWRLRDSARSPVKFKGGQSVLGNLLWVTPMSHRHPFLNISHGEANVVYAVMTAILLCFAYRGGQSVPTGIEWQRVLNPPFPVQGFKLQNCFPGPVSCHGPNSKQLRFSPTASSDFLRGTRCKQYPCSGWRGKHVSLCEPHLFLQLRCAGFSSLSWGYSQSLNRAVLQNLMASNAKPTLNKTRCSVWKSVQGLEAPKEWWL